MKTYVRFFCIVMGCVWMAACNNSSSPNSTINSTDTGIVSTDHTRNDEDTTHLDNMKPQVPVGDSLPH